MSGLVTTFTEALAARGGKPHVVDDLPAAGRVVAELCQGRPVVVDDDPVLTSVVDGLHRVDDPWAAEIGITTAAVAAASTSTLGLVFDAAHPRRTALVPPVHVAVVPLDRLVATYPEAVAALRALQAGRSGMRLVTGPSSSGDIEQVHIRGMHGPVEVHVILVGSHAADSDSLADTAAGDTGAEEPVAEPVAASAPEAAPGAAGRVAPGP